MLTNRPAFHIVDAAAMHLGAVSFSVYNQSSVEQLSYVLAHAGTRALVTERQFVAALRATGVAIDHLIVVDDGGLEALQNQGDPDFDLAAVLRAISPDDLITLIYTSGTTGPPKGVELTHANAMATLRAMRDCVHDPGPSLVSYLPAAHVVDRVIHHYGQMAFGYTITACPDLTKLLPHLVDARPTLFVGVPRVWEKLQAGLEGPLAAGRCRALRAKVGLDRLEHPLTGLAPTPPGVFDFFAKLGIELRDVWGMSETGASGIISPAGATKPGKIGKPMAGLEAKLDPEGELLVRGDCLMRGYRNMPEQSKDAFTDDGWLKTGDIASVDEDGYFSIVDRKKELIISSAGKTRRPRTSRARSSRPAR